MTERLDRANESAAPAGQGGVVVRGSAAGFAQEIRAGRHRLSADEPKDAGGTDTGADSLRPAARRARRLNVDDGRRCTRGESSGRWRASR